MLETLGVVVIVSMVGTSVVSLVAGHWLNRNNTPYRPVDRRPPAAHCAPPAALSPEIRDELDQTPAWWDRQFHALLEASGAQCEVLERAEITEKSFDGRVNVTYATECKVFSECTCIDCHRINTAFDLPF